MSQINSNATVTFKMKGLGIAHHNNDNGNWEFLFLREIPEHDLKIIVREYKNGLAYPVETFYPIPVDDKIIKISNVDSEPALSSFHTPASNFNWQVSGDDNLDSRWITDLSEELHKKPVKLKNKLGAKLTCLTVPDAVFYTDTLAKRPYNINFNGNFHFSRIMGEWLGLDLEWKAKLGQTEIGFESSLLPNRIIARDADVSIYEIEVNNDCCVGQKNIPSDFHYYYDYLVDMPGEVFDEEIPLSPPISNPISQPTPLLRGKEDDCHLVQCSKLDGITSLEELL